MRVEGVYRRPNMALRVFDAIAAIKKHIAMRAGALKQLGQLNRIDYCRTSLVAHHQSLAEKQEWLRFIL